MHIIPQVECTTLFIEFPIVHEWLVHAYACYKTVIKQLHYWSRSTYSNVIYQDWWPILKFSTVLVLQSRIMRKVCLGYPPIITDMWVENYLIYISTRYPIRPLLHSISITHTPSIGGAGIHIGGAGIHATPSWQVEWGDLTLKASCFAMCTEPWTPYTFQS